MIGKKAGTIGKKAHIVASEEPSIVVTIGSRAISNLIGNAKKKTLFKKELDVWLKSRQAQ